MRVWMLSLLSLLALCSRSRRSRPRRPASSTLERQLELSGRRPRARTSASPRSTSAPARRVSVKGNTPFPMASTVKIAVAALYLSQVDMAAARSTTRSTACRRAA